LFSRLPAVLARVFENPSGSRGVSKVEIARFSRLFWLGGLRRGAEVELRGQNKMSGSQPKTRLTPPILVCPLNLHDDFFVCKGIKN
jgi:hypothetical protein